MAKSNGRLTAKSVGEWFSVMEFEDQAAFLGELHGVHDKMRQVKISSLQRQLDILQGKHVAPTVNGRAKPAKRAKRKGSVKVKYRDPKSGETWSGRGRMATWLAVKVKAGEKADKYLA